MGRANQASLLPDLQAPLAPAAFFLLDEELALVDAALDDDSCFGRADEGTASTPRSSRSPSPLASTPATSPPSSSPDSFSPPRGRSHETRERLGLIAE